MMTLHLPFPFLSRHGARHPNAARQPFLCWQGRIGLALLVLLSACQSEGSSAASLGSASAAPPASAPINASAPSFTLTIDGKPQPTPLATLDMGSRTGNFIMGFEAREANVQLLGKLKAPSAVGKYAITDTTSTLLITGHLPHKPGALEGGKNELMYSFSAPFLVSVPADKPLALAFIYDWGQGLQELRGRALGQFVLSRVGGGTADGSFQSLTYVLLTNAPQIVQYKDRDRGYMKLGEHRVEGTFRNLPYQDAVKSLDELQKTLKAAEAAGLDKLVSPR